MDDLSINIPKGALEGVVNAHIQAAVTEALGRNPEVLVKAVVRAAMAQRKQHYNSKSIFEEQVSAMIRKTASEEFQKFLDEKRPAIADQIRAKFDGNAEKLVDTIAEKLVGHLGGSFCVQVYLKDQE